MHAALGNHGDSLPDPFAGIEMRYVTGADVLLLGLDTEGRIRFINTKTSSLLERSARELIGNLWIDICSPSRFREALQTECERVLKGDVSIVEHPILTKSGQVRLIEWHNTLVHDDGGAVIGTLSFGIDITNRGRASGLGPHADNASAKTDLTTSHVSTRGPQAVPAPSVRRHPELDVTLMFRDSVRRFVIRRGRGSEWFCEAWHDHVRVTAVAAERAAAVRCYEQYRQDVEELLVEGWRFHAGSFDR
jgi:PAS domain S-box-containing protein